MLRETTFNYDNSFKIVQNLNNNKLKNNKLKIMTPNYYYHKLRSMMR